MKLPHRSWPILALLTLQSLVLTILAGPAAAVLALAGSFALLLLRRPSDGSEIPLVTSVVTPPEPTDSATHPEADDTLPMPRGKDRNLRPLLQLLDRLTAAPDLFEAIAAGLAIFRRWTGADRARIILADLRRGGLLFSKDDRGHFEKRPSMGSLLPENTLPREWQAEERGEQRDLLLPLRIGDQILGALQLEGTNREQILDELPDALQLFALGLFSRLFRYQPDLLPETGRTGLLGSCLEEAGRILREHCRADWLVLDYPTAEGPQRRTLPGPPDRLDPPTLEALLSSLLEEIRANEGIMVRNQGVDGLTTAGFALLFGRCGRGTLLALRREGEFGYADVHNFRRLRDLLAGLQEEFQRYEEEKERRGRRELLQILSRDLEESLRQPENPDGFRELLASIARQLGLSFLALLAPGSPPALYCSGGSREQGFLHTLVEQGNLGEWLFQLTQPRNLSELVHLDPALTRFADGIGPGQVRVLPLTAAGDSSVLLLAVVPPGGPPLDTLLAGSDGFPRLLLTMLAALAATGTERRERARIRREMEQMERLAAIGRVAAGVAHEIRNPLGGVELYVSSLFSSLQDEKALRWLGQIREAVERMKRILSDLLLFARDGNIHWQKISLGVLLREALSFAAERFDSLGIRTELAGEDLLVQADSVRLRQVVDNLLANAAEALAGGGRVRLRMTREGHRALLVIEDDGPGIPGDHAGRIFDPFFTTRNNGTGLGLAISLKLMQNMGGNLRLTESSLGGAAFRLELPLAGE